MKKYLTYFILLSVVFVGCIIYGIAIVKYQVFPYEIIKTAYQVTQEPKKSNTPWAIGVYEGSTLFDLHAKEDVSNPVISAKDIVGMEADFVADPFMVLNNEKSFIFFEVLNKETAQGDIAYAESTDGKKWNYKKVIIDENFHLSYPYVFEWNNTYYLIPESNEDFSVRLYKATEFPEKWEYVGNILSGYQYLDPSIFRYKDKWWMFVSTGKSNVLNLYYSDDLLKGWQPHPKNPIVKLNKHFGRLGGRVILYDNKLLRFAQDDDPSYGIQIFAFEITELSETSYAEKLVSEKPIVAKTGSGWNAAGMHHVDPHKIGDKWVSTVDGRSK